MGANLPSDVGSYSRDPADTLDAALVELPDHGLQVIARSRFYATPCFPVGAGPDYVNAAAVLQATEDMTADAVLDVLHRIEAKFGRARSTRWAGRTLDLDLLAIGDAVLPDVQVQTEWRNLNISDQSRIAPDCLILPHPRLQHRGFVLVPLADVAPDWRHPVLGQTVRQMLAALPPESLADIHPLDR